MAKIKGTVLMVKDGKLLLLSNNKYYIAKGTANDGDTVEFESDDALPMPSYMFAIAAMEEENLDDTLDFIQSKWFSPKK
jgi:aminopeptidase N